MLHVALAGSGIPSNSGYASRSYQRCGIVSPTSSRMDINGTWQKGENELHVYSEKYGGHIAARGGRACSSLQRHA